MPKRPSSSTMTIEDSVVARETESESLLTSIEQLDVYTIANIMGHLRKNGIKEWLSLLRVNKIFLIAAGMTVRETHKLKITSLASDLDFVHLNDEKESVTQSILADYLDHLIEANPAIYTIDISKYSDDSHDKPNEMIIRRLSLLRDRVRELAMSMHCNCSACRDLMSSESIRSLYSAPCSVLLNFKKNEKYERLEMSVGAIMQAIGLLSEENFYNLELHQCGRNVEAAWNELKNLIAGARCHRLILREVDTYNVEQEKFVYLLKELEVKELIMIQSVEMNWKQQFRFATVWTREDFDFSYPNVWPELAEKDKIHLESFEFHFVDAYDEFEPQYLISEALWCLKRYFHSPRWTLLIKRNVDIRNAEACIFDDLIWSRVQLDVLYNVKIQIKSDETDRRKEISSSMSRMRGECSMRGYSLYIQSPGNDVTHPIYRIQKNQKVLQLQFVYDWE